MSLFDGLIAEGLRQMRFADPRGTDQQDISRFTNICAGRQFIHDLARDGGVEAEVEVVQRLELAERGGFDAALPQAFVPDVQFVLQDQFQKLGVAQPVPGRLL